MNVADAGSRPPATFTNITEIARPPG